MNAGAHGSDISKILTKAHILFADGTIEWLSNEEMEFSYRTSILQKKRPGIVVEAIFQVGRRVIGQKLSRKCKKIKIIEKKRNHGIFHVQEVSFGTRYQIMPVN